MPRYHFNIDNGHGFVPDEEGLDLADVDAARREAIKGIRSLIADEVVGGRVDLAGRLEVTDADGRLVLTLTFAEAVEFTGDSSPVIARVVPILRQ